MVPSAERDPILVRKCHQVVRMNLAQLKADDSRPLIERAKYA